MILLRDIRESDLDDLMNLAGIPGLFNLPKDPVVLKKKIRDSQKSFAGEMSRPEKNKFLFVAEDLELKKVVGTSSLATQHGTKDSPHFYFQVGSEQKYSQTINTGFIHGTLELHSDTDGPSEISGLVLDPDRRKSDDKIGRQTSFVRFLYMGLNRDRFKKEVMAELLPPINRRGQSPLWEAIGRRFTNMDYWEADRLCTQDKEFIYSLFPQEKIYTTFFSAEAKNAIGKLGKHTQPVFHMLTKIGFKYENHVDPFDGGPHLRAEVSELMPVKMIKEYVFDPKWNSGAKLESKSGLITKKEQSKEGFKAVHARVRIDGNQLSVEDDQLADQMASVLGLREKDSIYFMPYYE